MKLTAAISFLVAASIVSAAPSERDVVVEYNGFPEPFNFSFGNCIPFRMDGAIIESAQVNYKAKCCLYSDGQCQGASSGCFMAFPGIELVNPANFVETLGESGKCFQV